MGCVQAKPSTNSPPRELERLKSQYGYVGPRRSTGQRYPEREIAAARQSSREAEPLLHGGSGGGGGDAKLVRREDEEERGLGERKGNVSKRVSMEDEVLAQGWPKWLLDNVPNEVLAGLVPKSAESFDKLDKVGQGTYSNVYKARDKETGKIVALKKVRFDTSEPESIKFMAREITMLRQLDHPNIVKLNGLATSRMQYSLYLVFDFMLSDLARIISRPERLSEPQIKSYMHQLLSGLQHCHARGILHRDIKGSNLLIDKNGMLKIADFGLSNYYTPNQKRPLTNRVVTLWYRAPELLLGATDYGVGIDLWSAGCLMAEMFSGRPIMPGRTEVEQLHRIFKLCGTPSEEYWKKLKLSTTFRPPQTYKPSMVETFKDFPLSSLDLLKTLLSLDPAYRGSASSALQNEFFFTSPLACDLSGLPVIHNDDDELVHANDEKKKRRSRMRRSRTHALLRKADLSSEKPEDSIISKEVKGIENTVEFDTQTEDQSSITSSSTSFGVNPTGPRNTSASTISTSSTPYLAGQKDSLLFSTSSASTLFGVNSAGWNDTSTTTSSSSNQIGQKESPLFSISSSSTNTTGRRDTSISSFTTSGTSFSSNLAGLKGRGQLFPISPPRPSNQKTPVRTHKKSDANQDDKKLPPLPAKPQIRITNYNRDSSKLYKESQSLRSTSTREFRSVVNQKEHLKLYDIDD